MKFFAQGIRTVTSRDGSYSNGNNYSGINPNAPEADVPADLEVATQRGVVSGQPVLMVPYEMILTGTKARKELGPVPEAEEALKGDLPSFYLMVKLLKECERGVQSTWYHWLNSLPWWFCNGSSLTESSYELLPKVVRRLVGQEHTRFRVFAKAVSDAQSLSPRIRQDEALVHWAFCIVRTRSLPFNSPRLNYTDAQLIPNADMFNHSHVSMASISLETDPSTGNCLAVATKNVPGGHPLRRSYVYGDPSELLARYGFVDEQSPVVPSLYHIDNPSPEVRRVGYDPSKLVFGTVSGDIAQEVWDVLLYHVVLDQSTSGRADDSASDKNRARDQRKFLEAVQAGSATTSNNGSNAINANPAAKKIFNAIHAKYYSETAQALRNHVDATLHELEDSLRKATPGVGNNVTDSDPRLFLVNRHNAMLQQVFARVKQRLLNQKMSPTSSSGAAAAVTPLNNVDSNQDVWGMLQKY